MLYNLKIVVYKIFSMYIDLFCFTLFCMFVFIFSERDPFADLFPKCLP